MIHLPPRCIRRWRAVSTRLALEHGKARTRAFQNGVSGNAKDTPGTCRSPRAAVRALARACIQAFRTLLAPCQDGRRRERGHKALVRTDIRRGLMPTNVLLAGRQHHDLGRTPGLILGVTDKAPRGLANVLLMRRIVANAKDSQPWSPIVQGDGQVLRFSHKDICPLAPRTERAGSFEPAGSQQHRIRNDNGSGPRRCASSVSPSTSSRHPRLLTCGKTIPANPSAWATAWGSNTATVRAMLWVDGDYIIRESCAAQKGVDNLQILWPERAQQ